MNSKKLIRKLWKRFPIKIAKKYHDYVGLMEGKLKEETNIIVTCLDVSPFVIEKAKELNADLIISHHPFIYGKKKYVLLDPLKKSMYNELEQANIPVYSFHTNFDEGKGGMNDALVVALDLKNVRPIPNQEIGRMGELEDYEEVHDFAKKVNELLGLDYSCLLAYGEPMVKTIGIIGGAGSREYVDAIEAGCDIYLSGDTPYHIRREIIDKKLNYLHVDHEIEKIFIPTMKNILLEIDPNLTVIEVNDVVQAELIK